MRKSKTPNRVASSAGLGALVGNWRKNATEAREWGEKVNSVAEKTAARERAKTLDECAAAAERIGDEIHSLATRKNRASDIKRYLLGDLTRIASLSAPNDQAQRRRDREASSATET